MMRIGEKGFWESMVSRAGFVLLALACGYQLYGVFGPEEFFNLFVMDRDDAYYYLAISRNIVQDGFATFDEIHRTSGVQLLWTMVLSLLAVVFPGKVEHLRAMLCLSVLLNALSGVLFYRLATAIHSRLVGGMAVTLWAATLFQLAPTMQGLEYPLYIPVLLGCLWIWWKILDKEHPIGPGLIAGAGVLLVLNVWTRLDGAISSLFWGTSVLLVLWRKSGSLTSLWQNYRLHLAWFLGLTIVGALAFSGAMLWMGGTPLPISGAAKAYYASQYFAGYPVEERISLLAQGWVRVQWRSLYNGLGLPMLSHLGPRGQLAFRVAVLGTSLWLLARTFWNRVPGQAMFEFTQLDTKYVRRFAFLFFVAQVHVLAVFYKIGNFAVDTQHYYGLLRVFWVLWGAFLVVWCARQLPGLLRLPAIGMSTAGLAACALALAISQHSPPASSWWVPLEQARADMGRWLDASLPKGAIIGAWNAGQLSYATKHRVVNLDGLVNDAEFLDWIRQGRSLNAYLEREHIDYIVDQNRSDKSMPLRFEWNVEECFRGLWSFDDVRVLHHVEDLYALRVPHDLGPADDECLRPHSAAERSPETPERTITATAHTAAGQ